MTYRDFLNAIHDAPDDDEPRLEFADWLEKNGQPDRAEWIREGCKQGRLNPHDPNYSSIFIRRMECFERCRPPWWQHVTGVDKNERRGLVQFELSSKTAAARLGKASWLRQAFDEAWLEFIKIGANDEVIHVVAAWKSLVRDLPLFFRIAPQISDVGLTAVFEMPWLWGLELPSNAINGSQTVHRLETRTELRELSLDLRFLEPEPASLMIRQISPLTLLRRLWIDGGSRPDDEDIQYLSGLTELRLLSLSNCASLTDGGLVHLHGLTGLNHLFLFGCDAITDAGVKALRRALPSTVIKRISEGR